MTDGPSPVEAVFEDAFNRHTAGQIDGARQRYRAVLDRDPDHVESLHLLGLITAQSGDLAEGAAMIRRAMARAPGCAPHHNSLALAYRLAGQTEAAAAEYARAAALRPDSAEIQNNLASLLLELGQTEAAAVHFRRAADRAPEMPEIWLNLAMALTDSGAGQDAEAAFRRALSARRDFAPGYAGYGRWLTAHRRWTEARRHLREAVRLDPSAAAAWTNLGIACLGLGDAAEAESCYRAALVADPGFAGAHYNLGCLLAGQGAGQGAGKGRADAAIASHERAVAADPTHGAARLAACMARLPILYDSEAEVTARRADYLLALEDLAAAAADPAVARTVAAAIGAAQPFFLPCQGQNDRVPQRRYGELACRVLAASQPAAPLAARPSGGERIRIGIVSGFFGDHTIFRLFLEGWLTQIDRARFDVVGFHTGTLSDADTARAAGWCRLMHGLSSRDAWRAAVVAAAPHVLLYPEIGMDPVAAWLAAQRLAPVQCAAWGQPETTGLPTIDAFLSSEAMEPPDADGHYTEPLVRLPGLGIWYAPDEPPSSRTSRADLGLAEGMPVFWSGQALHKYAPAYDWIYPRIARAVGECRFVFIGFAPAARVTRAFEDRLDRAFAASGLDGARYRVMLPPMPQDRFAAAVGTADAILDTPGWSGGRSTLDCLAQNPAIVTWPGPFLRGRHTAAILRSMGCHATIAATLDDYVGIATRLALDRPWRDEVRRSVASGKERVFRDTAPIRALEAFLTETVRGRG